MSRLQPIDAHSPEFALLAKLEGSRRELATKAKRQHLLMQKYSDESRRSGIALKAIDGDIALLSGAKDLSVSLLYKKINGTYYIKGRTWWHGKQREVQIGTIEAVLKRVGWRAAKGASSELPSWNRVKSDGELSAMIKDIGRTKLLVYIERSLIKSHQVLGGAAPVFESESETVTDRPPLPETTSSDDGNWYDSWRDEYATEDTV